MVEFVEVCGVIIEVESCLVDVESVIDKNEVSEDLSFIGVFYFFEEVEDIKVVIWLVDVILEGYFFFFCRK